MILYSTEHSVYLPNRVVNSTFPAIEVTSTSQPTTVHPVLPEQDSEQEQKSATFHYILVPLVAIAFLLIMSGLMIIYVRKRRIDRLRCHLMPLYNFDATDDHEWEAELLDDLSENHSLRRGYKSMEFPLSLSIRRFS